MKSYSMLLLCLIIFTGCTYKNEALALKPYDSSYAGPLTKSNPTLYVRLVKDVRIERSRIGTIIDNGKELAPLMTQTDFQTRYTSGLNEALRLAGFNTDTGSHIAKMVVEVYLKEIDITYNDKNFDTNLKGEIDLEVIIRRGDEVITQNFKQKGGKWIKPSFNSKDLEPFLYELFSDSIDQIVSRLVKL